MIALWRRALDLPTFWSVLIDTGYVTASLILIIASASMFSRFLALSGVPAFLGNWVQHMQFGLYSVMLVYVLVVLVLGTALDLNVDDPDLGCQFLRRSSSSWAATSCGSASSP